ncbi:MAG: tetratricopeptide repeat protein [Crocinitomicaceae bacterium]|nr:tetratricopeptide repeat protein [Crocinitomicaceae bacterium]MDP4866824.1 tetratricopeptide repeat protein [Crocinitomicaceae bacterium]MDP5010766.1 tetratricopeptide repeat protein [Crocinitomicaceae bacterium]
MSFFILLPTVGHSQTAREKQLLESIRKEKDESKRFKRLLILGEYYKSNNIYRADSLKDVLLQKSRVFDDSIRFSALIYSAEVNEILGRQEEYFRDVLGCQQFLNRLNTEEVSFKIYKHLGNYHSNLLEFETADFYLKNAQKIAEKKRQNAKIAEVKNLIAFNFMLDNKKDSALRYTEMSIQFARRTSNKSILAESFNTQARVYAYFGQLELSVAKNIISLQLALEVNDRFRLAKYNRELGVSQRLIYNLNDAEYYFKQSYEHAQKIADYHQMGLALSNLGTIYFGRKEFKKAIESTQRAIRLLSELNDFNGLGEAYDILGMIYREQKDYTLAASSFNKSLVFYESTGNKEKIAGVYHNVGTVFRKQKKYANALNYLQRSIEIREQFGSKNQIYSTYREIADVYRDVGKTNEALKYLDMYLDYQDSNTTIQSATKIAELSELYRSEQRDRLIMMQSDSIERQRQERAFTSTKLENVQLRNNSQMYFIIGFLIISVLAGIIVFYRWNQTRIKQERKEAEMSQTLLRAQMNPHFVFNAMSVIQSYIYENDTENSSKFLVNFSRLMRLILENSPKEFIPIETEIEILQKYLETQKLRFEDRFDYSIECEDILFEEGAVIPPMITQPFIENAIEHGQLHTIEGGFILISFSKQNNMLNVIIEDNGIGRKGAELNKKSKDHKSMAMKITKDRIDNMSKKYRTEGRLIVEDFNKKLNTGTKVLISLPYKAENLKNS